MEQQLQEVMGHAANGTARRPARRRSHSQGSEIALSVANPAVTPSSQDLAALKAPPSATKTETLECPQEDASRAQPARPAEEPPAPAAGAQAGNGSRASAPPPSQVVTAEAVSEVPPGGLGPALSAEGGGRSGGSPVFAPGASPRGSQPVSRLCPQCFDCASSWLGYARALPALLASSRRICTSSLLELATALKLLPCIGLAPVQWPRGSSEAVVLGGVNLRCAGPFWRRPRWGARWWHWTRTPSSPATTPSPCCWAAPLWI